MMWPQLESVAEIVTVRIVNSLPAGLLIAVFAWVLLRLLPRQNSGTRFAVWLMALLAVAGLPFIATATPGHSFAEGGNEDALFKLPGQWGLLLFLVWAVAASVAMLRLVSGLWRVRQLRKSCIKIDAGALHSQLQNTIASLSRSRTVTLATSKEVSVPAAIGFFKPMIVIPSWALSELPPEELNIILVHEFAHLRRWDDWTNLLQKIVRAVFVFHPAVWWIENRLSLEREMACDDRVLAETANPRGYAKCLIGLLEKSVARRGWSMAQAVVHRMGEASLRLARILDVNRPATRMLGKPALGLAGVFSLVCLVAAPHAPQVVAFEPNTPAIQVAEMHPAVASPSPMPPAFVVPAALHTVTSASPNRAAKRTPARASKPTRLQLEPNPSVIAARWSPDDIGSSVKAVNVDPNQILAPTETLLIIRTTQRIGPNSWVWSVAMWRVTFVNSTEDGMDRVVGPRKT